MGGLRLRSAISHCPALCIACCSKHWLTARTVSPCSQCVRWYDLLDGQGNRLTLFKWVDGRYREVIEDASSDRVCRNLGACAIEFDLTRLWRDSKA